MATDRVRDLNNRLTRYLGDAKQAQFAALAASGFVILPTGQRLARVRRVRVSGPPVSRTILEDRH